MKKDYPLLALLVLLSLSFVITVLCFWSFWNAPRVEQPTFLPKLVGFGCEGASGALYADEESDFPLCKEIHVIVRRTE